MLDLNFWRITGLALADSVNPCAIAVLTMILMSILIQNPEKKKKVLYGGLGFILAVYVGYLVYGLIIVEFFNVFALFLRENSVYLYNGLAILAMVIGALNVKDFFNYKKGGIATEMPLFLRPKVKRVIEKVTSPSGAFVIGFVVTLFLLPCTIGPYIIASGLLAELGVLGALPWLLYYNVVFVLPMLAIVFLVYYGFTKIDEVSGWKERNIKLLHLIAGLLMFLVGVLLLVGWL
ncbi:cytochrome c biogenesis CcdA family protein [Nanoarchaeota archaeon]